MTYDRTFTIPMTPHGKPRGRVVKRGAHYGIKADDRARKSWHPKRWVQEFALRCAPFAPSEPLSGPVCVDLLLVFPRPKAWTSKRTGAILGGRPAGMVWHTSKPDRDNADKLVLDALTKTGRWWGDDCQIAAGTIFKVIAEHGGEPRIVIRVRELTTSPAGVLADLGWTR